jgi:penicillin-binding protein 1C
MTKRLTKWQALICVPLTLFLIRLCPSRFLRDLVPQSTTVWSADGELLRATLAADGQYRIWTPLREMSPVLIDAFRLKEDRWFYWHPGVNPVSLTRAAAKSWRGPTRQGGSTITMQLARMVYHLNTKTPAGKFKQSIAAMWLEARYSKRSILEAYLNLVPFGGNIQGVGAASRVYLDKPPSEIALGEAVTLAVIPQRPAVRAGHSAEQGRLLAARARLQLALPVLPRPDCAMPMHAPHFTDAMLQGNPGVSGHIETTLDFRLQRLVERQLDRYLTQFGERGIRNAATLLVDYRDMSVKAWVGSAGYLNEPIHGQINGVLTKRSPGSTLKPFIYALALDQGVLHPRTILRDAPTAFGPYTPENFDGNFVGPIPAQDALIRSRNIPAAWVATQLRQPDFYQFLQSAGVSGMKPESYYGLALALGGGEVTMEELASLYAMLANNGVLQPIQTRPAEPKREALRLLSPEASFITFDMLSHNPRHRRPLPTLPSHPRLSPRRLI